MIRYSVSLTKPNDDWLKAQLDNEEYASKSEIVNDLIRRARESDMVRQKLIEAEQSGFINQSREDMLTDIKNMARQNGLL